MPPSRVLRPPVLWLTGLSGAGKSTISDALVEELERRGVLAARLDGDDLRGGLNSDLGFSIEDRAENLRRAAHVARLFSKLGHVTVCSFITPLQLDRQVVAGILEDLYVEVYVRASLAECERRDPKGLYKRARTGEIRDFTGVSAAFEEPESPHIVLDTQVLSVADEVRRLIDLIESKRCT